MKPISILLAKPLHSIYLTSYYVQMIYKQIKIDIQWNLSLPVLTL